MKRSFLALMVLALGGAAGVSYAAENPSGFYLGAGIGQFNVNIDDIDVDVELPYAGAEIET